MLRVLLDFESPAPNRTEKDDLESEEDGLRAKMRTSPMCVG